MISIITHIRWFFGIALLIAALTPMLIGTVLASRDDERHEHHEHDDDNNYRSRSAAWRMDNQTYREECGACHVAYPARLLPPRSWALIMKNLDDHFGENAELFDDARWADVAMHLQANAADPESRILRGTSDEIPQRISALPWFQHEHDEISASQVADNDEVLTFSNCDACHQAAAKGVFDDDNVSIPGHGAWYD